MKWKAQKCVVVVHQKMRRKKNQINIASVLGTNTHTHTLARTHVSCAVLRCVVCYCVRGWNSLSPLHHPPPQSPLYTISLIIESKDKHTVLHTHTQTYTEFARVNRWNSIFCLSDYPAKEGRKEASRQTRTLYLKSKTTIKRLNTKQKTVNKKRWC